MSAEGDALYAAHAPCNRLAEYVNHPTAILFLLGEADTHVPRASAEAFVDKLLGLGDLHFFDEPSHARLVRGVREYASPEAKIEKHPLDASADLYSVAMILFAEVAEDRAPPVIELEDSHPPTSCRPRRASTHTWRTCC